jgi:hypothetical protein
MTPEDIVREWWDAMSEPQRRAKVREWGLLDDVEDYGLPWELNYGLPWDQLQPTNQQSRILRCYHGLTGEG